MACVLTNGLTKECKHQFGGLKELWLVNFDEIDSVMADETTGQITGVTLDATAELYQIEFVKDTGQVLEELQINGAASFINQTVNFQAGSITQASKQVLNDLSLSKVVAIVKKADNNYWMVGDPRDSAGLEATTVTNDTGTAQTDGASATIALAGASLDYGNQIESSVVEGLLAG